MQPTSIGTLLGLACFGYTLCSQTVQADTPETCIDLNRCNFNLNIGSTNNFPPINFLDNNKHLAGFGRDVSDAAMASLGVGINRKHSDVWTEVLDWLKTGQIDLIHDAAYSEARTEFLEFSEPIITMPEVIFTTVDRIDIHNFQSLQGKTVACVDKHISHLYLQQFPQIQCHIVKRPIDGLTALLSGEADAFVYPREIALYFLQRQKLVNKIKILPEAVRQLDWSMAATKGDRQIIGIVNKGLANIKQSGEYQRIYDKWYGTRILSGYSQKELSYIVVTTIIVSVISALLVILLFRDRKLTQTKDALEATLQQLQKSTEERDNYFSLSLDMLCIASCEGYFLDLNPSWEKALGYTLEELKSQPFMSFVHPDDVADTTRELAALNNPIHKTIGFQNRYRCKDGSYRWITWNAIRSPDNKTIYAAAHDVTQHKLVSEQLANARNELEQRVAERTEELQNEILERESTQRLLASAKQEAERANRAKSEFLSSMSHELRTPMNAILGFAQLIELESTKGANAQLYSQEILSAGKHLLNLINEVLDLAKIESGNFRLTMEAVDWKPIVEECLTLLNPAAKKQHIEFVANYPDSNNLAVYADRVRLKQVTLNLLSNAVKYNSPYGYIRIDFEVINGFWRILISDNGIGIAAELRDRIFQPFDRLSPSSAAVEGTGIGLVISKRLTESMKGSIDFSSEPGKGSTFWVDIPKAAKISSQSNKDTQPFPLNRELFDSPKTILYIEDNPSNVILMQEIFRIQKNIHLLCANTPSQGLELAQAQRPDLILLDINLPEMDGYEVKKRLQSNPGTKDIKVVAVSANAMDKDIAKGAAAGFAAYVTKPIDVDQLYRNVKRVLQEAVTEL
ncbi:MAG: transporter substrate-binding domain-containing protein [Gammaproteobacteria bacterium]|nr:transporter substrate-binding domain-containing protein [Gammaproteobacteria bacterium]MDH5799592.1 transporter substrate-binding domain-containing protein [Gammaproteobacteria bacterium]